MDKRIVDLKSVIIKENIELIKENSVDSTLSININKKITTPIFPIGNYLTKFVVDGNTIMLVYTDIKTNVTDMVDIKLLDIENIDYCVSEVLNNMFTAI